MHAAHMPSCRFPPDQRRTSLSDKLALAQRKFAFSATIAKPNASRSRRRKCEEAAQSSHALPDLRSSHNTTTRQGTDALKREPTPRGGRAILRPKAAEEVTELLGAVVGLDHGRRHRARCSISTRGFQAQAHHRSQHLLPPPPLLHQSTLPSSTAPSPHRRFVQVLCKHRRGFSHRQRATSPPIQQIIPNSSSASTPLSTHSTRWLPTLRLHALCPCAIAPRYPPPPFPL
jgi:hypothetical protein